MNKTISEKKADPVPSKKLLMIVVILLSAATCGITSAKAAAAEGWEAPRSAVGRDPDESSVVYHGRWEESCARRFQRNSGAGDPEHRDVLRT